MTESITSRLGVVPELPCGEQMVAVARSSKYGTSPLNGLRHPPEGSTCGWYIWTGEDADLNEENFFEPFHVKHLLEEFPEIGEYLSLPPGYRFLLAAGYEDVWYDEKLLVL